MSIVKKKDTIMVIGLQSRQIQYLWPWQKQAFFSPTENYDNDGNFVIFF